MPDSACSELLFADVAELAGDGENRGEVTENAILVS